jgi:hypothetical protein
LGSRPPQISSQQRTDDVEQADHGDGPAADFRRQAALHQVGGHVDVDEGQMETADEEADD